EPCDFDRIVKLSWLDENKKYYIKELDLTASGKALQNAGLPYPALSDCESWSWHLEEIK
ncbi:MAG: GH36 C-terminal domain-containing protein, partial [Clostridia bacterium]|nr:GH36 C-terminal domain-containing protein [Clostridia bacterium]